MNWDHVFASRTARMKASEIRELLKQLDQPDIISFAGGIPDPAISGRDQRYPVWPPRRGRAAIFGVRRL